MKKIRNHVKKIALFLSFSILFISCSENEQGLKTNLTSLERNGEKYTGEEIFRGIFFFENDVSEGIPQLAQLKSEILGGSNNIETLKSLKELSNISVNFINDKYPNYFKELQAKIYSNNLFEINEALNLSSELIEQAALSSEKFQSIFLFGKKMQTDTVLQEEVAALNLNTETGKQELKYIISLNTPTNESGFIGIWAAVAAVYVVVAVVSIVIGAYSVYFKVAYWGSRNNSSNIFSDNENDIKIEHDILINEIALNFN